MIDHIYYCSNQPNTITLSQKFLERYSTQITIINLPNVLPTSKIFDSIIRHLKHHENQLNNLTIDQLPWVYYVNKYYDTTRTYNSVFAWENWSKKGINEKKNPLNRITLHSSEINHLIYLIAVLLDAKTNNYHKILMINADHQPIKYPDFLEIFANFSQHIELNNLCFFSYNKKNYGYSLSENLYDVLLSETSYFINSIDDLLSIYINTYNTPHQIFDHSINECCDLITTNISTYFLHQISIDLNQLTQQLSYFRHTYYLEQYNLFMNEFHLDLDEQAILNYIISKLPFDMIKIKYNAWINLNFHNYLYLCAHFPTYDYTQTIKMKKLSDSLPDLNTLYFDHELYLSLYPIYHNSFKSYFDSYAHFITHGVHEHLIGNQVLFKLARLRQKYLVGQYLRYFESLIQYPNNLKNLVLYNDQLINCNVSIPIIYVLTRTSQRPKLFDQCYRSVKQQLFCLVRHLVSFDTETTRQYVTQYNHLHQIIDLTGQKGLIHPNQYIDFFYDRLLTEVPGWVLVLDDDDCLFSEYVFYYLQQYLTNPEICIIWMLARPDKFIYPCDKNNPILGEIGSCCYLYHTSKIKKNLWGGNSTGDFNFFKYIFNNTKQHLYVDFPLTGVNYKKKLSGWSAL